MPSERVTFSCGHEGRIELQGRRADREAKAAWLAERRTCQSCYDAAVEAERAEAREKAAAQAAEFELPDLMGTEKQVDWAMRIRADVVAQKDGADALLAAKLGDDTFLGAKPDAVLEAFEDGFTALIAEQRAAWWIERGGHLVQSEPQPFIAGVIRWHRERVAAGVDRTTVIRPAGREPISIVSVSHRKDAVVVTTAKRESDTFTDLLKDIGFRWVETRWEYRCMPSSAPIDHVAAGVASEIVAAGYAVGIAADLGALVSSGDFEAEMTRKVCTHESGKRFLLEWRRSDDLYNVVKSVPGARWVGYGMSVPLTSASEVADLAERLGFWMSTMAQDAIASVDALVVAGKRVEVGASRDVAATPVQGGVHADLVDH